MGVFSRYISQLSPVFSRDPQAFNALSVTGSGYLSIDNDTLTLSTGSTQTTYALGNFTVSTLAQALTSAGLPTMVVQNGGLSASVLLDGGGGAPITLQGFSAPNYLLFKAAAYTLDQAQQTVQASAQQLNPRTASGMWLEFAGEALGVTRVEGEPDSLYAERMLGIRFGHNVNNIALQNFFSRMGYTTQVTDTDPGAFSVDVTLPTAPPQGFTYTTTQLQDALSLLKASGTIATILLQGLAQDAILISDAANATITTNTAYDYPWFSAAVTGVCQLPSSGGWTWGTGEWIGIAE